MGKKRRLRMKWGIMLVVIGLVVIQTKAYGESWNWIFFSHDLESDLFYDSDTVNRLPENIIRVWWKEVFHTKEELRPSGFTRSEYEKAAYQINVSEINCKKKECRRRFYMICSEEGGIIFSNIHRRQLEEWVPVWQEHSIGALYWKLCR